MSTKRILPASGGQVKKTGVLCLFLFIAALTMLHGQTLYWVGNSGDWDSTANWSASSGGVGGAGPPTATTNVVFDGQSFSASGHAVSVTGGAAVCRNMTWLNQGGNSPALNFTSSSTLAIHGSMALHASMAVGLVDAAERIVFAGTGGPHTVASAGKILPGLRFDGAGGTWDLADDLKVASNRAIRVAAGQFNTQNRTVDCGYLITEGTAACGINIGDSRFNIRANNEDGIPVLDLRNPNLTWTVPGPNAMVQFTNPNHYVVILTGPSAKTLPDFLFESIPAGTGPADIDIHTDNGADRITFREIRVTRTTGTQLKVTGTAPKTYSENIILPDYFEDNDADNRTFDGTANPPPNNNIYQGSVAVGTGSGIVFKGNNTFQGRVTIAGTKAEEDAVQFTADCIFNDVVDITGSAFVFPYRQANVRFDNSVFNHDVFLRGKDAVFRFGGALTQAVNRNFNVTDDAKAIFTGTQDNTFSDGLRTGLNVCAFNGTLSLGQRAEASFTNTGANTYNILTADKFSVIRFTPMPGSSSTITGAVTLAGGCAWWVTILSGVSGRQADVTFSNVQNWTATVVQDIRRVGGAAVTVNNGVDNGNNSGITFNASASNPVMYWVGGDPANTSGNNLWSDPKNWAIDINDANQRINGGSCIPDANTGVIFERRSFSNNANNKYTRVQVDVPLALCRDMTWTDDVNGNTGGILPRLITSSSLNTVLVGGNLRFAPPAAMENFFTGAFEFAARGPATIDANGAANGPAATPVTRFNGHVIFSGRGGQWQLQSDILVNGGQLGNMIFEYGSVSAIASDGTSRNITLDGNWFVRRPQDGGAQATVDFGDNTVNFNGDATNPNPQYIISGPPVAPNLNDFYNVVINRHANGTANKAGADNSTDVAVWNRFDVGSEPGTTSALPNPNTPFNSGITVRNNLSVLRGAFWDNGFQIVGNATGNLTVADGANLHIGAAVDSGTDNNSPMTSRFPTGFVRNKIDLQPGSTVVYRSRGHQDVSDVPLYANLYNYNPNKNEAGLAALTGNNTRKRLALGPLQINGRLTIEQGILFADNGFQITGTAGISGLTMQTGGILMLGSSAMNIATSYGAGSNPATNTTGIMVVSAANTQFPLNFDDTQLDLNASSIVIYNGGDAAAMQPVRGLNSVTASQQYGHLLFANTTAAPTSMVEKRFMAAATVRGVLRVYPNANVTDDGFQITGNAANVLSMYNANNTDISNLAQQPFTTKHTLAGPSQLVIGSPGSSSEFPTLFTNQNIELQTNTTVIYNSGQNTQQVRRLSSGNAINNYARLIIRNPNGAVPVARKFIGANPVDDGSGNLTVQENLTVEGFADLQDAGFQIRRRTAGGILAVRDNGFLTIGTVSTAASPAIPNTAFPPLFDAAAVDFGINSTVRYNAGGGVSQEIRPLPNTGNQSYGNLLLTNADTTGGAPALSMRNFAAPTTIRRDFRILRAVAAYDRGFQVTGSTTGRMAMDANALLYIGDANSGNGATRFPDSYLTPNISLNDLSVVHYYDFASPQQVSLEPEQYGILRLGAVSGSSAPDNSPFQVKVLTPASTTKPSVGVRTHLLLYPDCELRDNGYQVAGFAGTTSFTMSRNTRLQVGNALTATRFPSDVDQSRVDLDLNSTVEYNAGNGSAGSPQLIRGLFDTGSLVSNQNYANVVLTNPLNSAFIEKQLAGNARVRGSLTIGSANELNVGGSNYNINIQGNWFCLGGRFVSGSATGTVTFEGGGNQTVITCSTGPYLTEADQDFQNVVFNKAAVGNTVTLASRFAVKGTATFNTGVVIGGGMTAPFATSPTNVMIFRDNATAANASDNSLVIGSVRKVGRVAGTFYFPIGVFVGGSTPFYRPSGISTATNADASFISQYYLQNPNGFGFTTALLQSSLQCVSGALQNVSNREFWIINRENLTDNVAVTLTWRNPQSAATGVGAAANDYTGLRVSRWNSTLWQNLGGAHLIGSDNNNGAVASLYNTAGCTGPVNSFSPFTLASETAFNPLPVTLIDFSGRPLDGKVLLNWLASDEKNVARYLVERSADGVGFKPIGTVKALGNSSLLSYQHTDAAPIKGVGYYRLRIEDLDGSHAYSRIISVTTGGQAATAVVLYPNPSEGKFIHVYAEHQFTVTAILDLAGRRVAFRTDEIAAGRLYIRFSQKLPAGLYVAAVQRTNGGQPEWLRFTVK